MLIGRFVNDVFEYQIFKDLCHTNGSDLSLFVAESYFEDHYSLNVDLLGSKDAKNPYEQRFIAGLPKCSTKPLSVLLTQLRTHIKQGLQKY